MTYTEEFDSPADFIAGQLADFDVLPDEGIIRALEVAGEKVEFSGTILDLYNLYTK
jgi:predicted ester cyclase